MLFIFVRLFLKCPLMKAEDITLQKQLVQGLYPDTHAGLVQSQSSPKGEIIVCLKYTNIPCDLN